VAFTSCEGPKGPEGLDGQNGTNGVDGANGVDGTNGEDGEDLTSQVVLKNHSVTPSMLTKLYGFE